MNCVKCDSKNTTYISSRSSPPYERSIITPISQRTDLIVENYKCNQCGSVFELTKKF